MADTLDIECDAYLDAWSRKDLAGLAACLHPDVRFKGPLLDVTGRDAMLAAVKAVFPLLRRYEVRAKVVAGDRAMFAYDFICREPIGVYRTAELVRFDGRLIRDIELFFDPRPFEALQRTS